MTLCQYPGITKWITWCYLFTLYCVIYDLYMYCVLCTCTIFCIYLLICSPHIFFLGGGRIHILGFYGAFFLICAANGPEVEATRGTTQNRPAMYDVQHFKRQNLHWSLETPWTIPSTNPWLSTIFFIHQTPSRPLPRRPIQSHSLSPEILLSMNSKGVEWPTINYSIRQLSWRLQGPAAAIHVPPLTIQLSSFNLLLLLFLCLRTLAKVPDLSILASMWKKKRRCIVASGRRLYCGYTARPRRSHNVLKDYTLWPLVTRHLRT